MEHLDHPSPHFNDAKMVRFCTFAPSSLLWGGWGMIVPFYSVQDCRFWKESSKVVIQMRFASCTCLCSTHIQMALVFSTALKNITSACLIFSGPYQKSWMERPGNFYKVKGNNCFRDMCSHAWLRDSSYSLKMTSVIRQKNKDIGGSKNYCNYLSQLFNCLPGMISSCSAFLKIKEMIMSLWPQLVWNPCKLVYWSQPWAKTFPRFPLVLVMRYSTLVRALHSMSHVFQVFVQRLHVFVLSHVKEVSYYL